MPIQPINIQITADQAQLQSMLTVARTNMQQLQSQANNLAGQMSRLGAAAQQQLQPQLDAVTASLIKARIETEAYSSKLNDSIEHTISGTKGLADLNLATAGTTREFIVLGHEALRGNFSRIPGSIMVLGERIGGLHSVVAALATPFGAATAAVGILAVGLGYLAAQAYNAAGRLETLANKASFLSGFTGTSEDVKKLTNDIKELGNVSKADAEKIIDSSLGVKNGTNETARAVADAMLMMKVGTGESAESIAKDLKGIFSGDLTKNFDSFSKAVGGTTAEEAEAAKKVRTSNEMLSLMLDIVARKYDLIKDKAAGVQKTWGEVIVGLAAGMAAVTQENATQADDLRLKALQDRLQKLRTDAEAAGKAVKGAITPADEVKSHADEASQKANPELEKRRGLLNDIKDIKAAIDGAAANNSPKEKVDEWTASLGKAKEALAEIDNGGFIANAKEEASKLAVTWKGSAAELEQAQANMYRKDAENADLSAKQKASFVIDANNLQKRANDAFGQDAIRQTVERNTAIQANDKLTATQKLAAEAANWRALLAGDKLNHEQRSQAEGDLNRVVGQLGVTSHAEQLAALKSVATAAKEGSVERIAAERAVHDYAVQTYGQESKQASEAQTAITTAVRAEYDKRVKIAQDSINKEHVIDNDSSKERVSQIQFAASMGIITRAQETQKLMDEENKRFNLEQEYYRKIQSLYAKDSVEFNKAQDAETKSIADHKIAQQKEAQKLYQQQYQDVLSVTSKITGAFANSVTGIITGQMTLKQAAANILSSMLSDFIGYLAERAAKWATQMILELMGFTVNKEGQVVVTATAEAEKKAIEKTAASSSIMQDAYQAAAGAYNAIVGIPYVGPVLAPIAAGVAFAAVAAYDSFDVGTPNVPADMLANIHQGEIIVPKTFSDSIRSGEMTLGSGGGSSSGDSYHVTINAVDSQSVQRLFAQNGQALVASLANQKRNLNNQMKV